jgi:hypothetical protein
MSMRRCRDGLLVAQHRSRCGRHPGHVRSLRALKQRGGSGNAASMEQVVRYLISIEADINAKNDNGAAPLNLAAQDAPSAHSIEQMSEGEDVSGPGVTEMHMGRSQQSDSLVTSTKKAVGSITSRLDVGFPCAIRKDQHILAGKLAVGLVSMSSRSHMPARISLPSFPHRQSACADAQGSTIRIRFSGALGGKQQWL